MRVWGEERGKREACFCRTDFNSSLSTCVCRSKTLLTAGLESKGWRGLPKQTAWQPVLSTAVPLVAAASVADKDSLWCAITGKVWACLQTWQRQTRTLVDFSCHDSRPIQVASFLKKRSSVRFFDLLVPGHCYFRRQIVDFVFFPPLSDKSVTFLDMLNSLANFQPSHLALFFSPICQRDFSNAQSHFWKIAEAPSLSFNWKTTKCTFQWGLQHRCYWADISMLQLVSQSITPNGQNRHSLCT